MNIFVRFVVLVTGVWLAFGALGHAQLCDEQVPDSLRWPDSLGRVFSLPDGIPFGMGLCIIAHPALAGVVDMELRILSNYPCDSIRVRLSPIGRLEVLGQTDWLVDEPSEGTLKYPIQVIIPDQDTSGVVATISITGWADNWTDMYFVTTGDTLEAYYEWPKPVVVRRQKMIYPWGDTVEVLNDTPGQRLFLTPAGDTLDADGLDLWYKRENEEHNPPPDTINIRHESIILPEGILARTAQGRKELMEREPFLTGRRQAITVDGQLWVRDSGEYKFRPGLQMRNGPAYMDSVMKAREEQGRHDTVHVVLDLRSPADYDTVKRVVDDLRPMDRPGFYHAFITREVSAELERTGIKLCRYPRYPDVPRPRITPKPDDDKHNSLDTGPTKHLDKPMEWECLFSDNFESGDWSSKWYAADYDYLSGYDYWGRIEYGLGRVNSGLWSAWCASYGNMPLGVNYDNDMNSWMYNKNPIIIKGYDEIELCVSMWYCTETYYDEFLIAFAYDPTDWWGMLFAESGDCGYGMLTEEPFDIEPDRDSLYVIIGLTSDYANRDFEGAYIDDVEVYGNRPFPNLHYYAPGGWSGPIVPSSQTGTTTTGPLWADEPTYIDVCAINWGDFNGVAGPFIIALFVDNVWKHNFYVTDSTIYGSTTPFYDYPITLTKGYHTLKIIVDYANSVPEIDEYDNVWEGTFEWQYQWFTAGGYVRYMDMSQGGAVRNARGVRVELWDDNIWHSDELLGTDTSDNLGYFAFGPIENMDYVEGGRLDIYTKAYADNEAATAYVDPYPPSNASSFQSEPIPNVSGEWISVGLPPASESESGGFYAIDCILTGYEKWDSLVSFKAQPSKVGVYFVMADPTGFVREINGIRLNKSANDNMGYPDVFDYDVISHEYGHKLERYYQFLDSSSWTPHNWWDSSSLIDAGCEGFAHFWSAYVANDQMIRNSWANFQQYLDRNIENGEHGRNDSIRGSSNDYGSVCEGSVAGMLWDIHDSNDDDYTR